MKEVVLENLLKFLVQHDRYYVHSNGEGFYTLHNAIMLDMPELNGHPTRDIFINFPYKSITYTVKGFNARDRWDGTLEWDKYVDYITKELKNKVRSSLDVIVREEDNARLRKSRECRVNRRLLQMTEMT